MANGKEEVKTEEKKPEATERTKFFVRLNVSDLEKLGIESREGREVAKEIRNELGLPASTRAPGKMAKIKQKLGLKKDANIREVRDALLKKSGMDNI